jgi:hypothetical protein
MKPSRQSRHAVTRGQRHYKRRRPLGLAPWTPQRDTMPMVEAIDDVLDEYRDQWPLTVRQVMYRLIGLGFRLPKKKKAAADYVGDKLNRGRRSLAAGRGRRSATTLPCERGPAAATSTPTSSGGVCAATPRATSATSTQASRDD